MSVVSFKYGGKEFVEMSGLDEYDSKARWYYPAIMRTTTMDPLCEKYYSTSPYAWCNNNPVNLVDPDGKKIFFAPGVSDQFKNDFKIAVTYMNEHKISNLLYKLNESDKKYWLAEGEQGTSSEFNTSNQTITWASRTKLITNLCYELSPIEILNHELDHAIQYDEHSQQQLIDANINDEAYGNAEEKRVIQGSEQTTAQKLGKLKKHELTRNDHQGALFETTSPISTDDILIVTPHKE